MARLFRLVVFWLAACVVGGGAFAQTSSSATFPVPATTQYREGGGSLIATSFADLQAFYTSYFTTNSAAAWAGYKDAYTTMGAVSCSETSNGWTCVGNYTVTVPAEGYSGARQLSSGGYKVVSTESCPPNSSSAGAGQCSCNSGYTLAEDGKSCKPVSCPTSGVGSKNPPTGDLAFDWGTSDALVTGNTLTTVCNMGCTMSFDGAYYGQSALVGGVKHYFASGNYTNTGATCASGNDGLSAMPEGSEGIPDNTCAAGQTMGTVNGKVTCVGSASGGASSPSGAASSASSTTSTKSPVTTNGDGSTSQTTTETTTNSDGSTSTTTTTVTTHADGSQSTSSQTVKTGATAASGAGSGSGSDGACETNPMSVGCGGSPASIGPLREKGTKTISDVLTAQKAAFLASPIGTAVGGFFTVSGGGTCPVWTWNIEFFGRSYTLDTFCADWALTAYGILKVALLIGVAFLAFRIAIE